VIKNNNEKKIKFELRKKIKKNKDKK